MKKENKKMAQERRAKERQKQANKKRLLNILKFGIPALAVILLVVLIIWDPFTTEEESDTNTNTESTADTDTTDSNTESDDNATYTPAELDADLTYYADIAIENYGTITVKLDQASAPISAANFVTLAEDGFYDGLTFHRIKEGFVMQGGDPNGNGSGGSENNIVGEFTENGYDNDLSHTRGAISMARSDAYDSASSQFFIVHEDSTYLDGQYAVFGYVTEGMDVVDKVCEDAEPTDDNGTIKSDEQPVITSISIRTEQYSKEAVAKLKIKKHNQEFWSLLDTWRRLDF